LLAVAVRVVYWVGYMLVLLAVSVTDQAAMGLAAFACEPAGLGTRTVPTATPVGGAGTDGLVTVVCAGAAEAAEATAGTAAAVNRPLIRASGSNVRMILNGLPQTDGAPRDGCGTPAQVRRFGCTTEFEPLHWALIGLVVSRWQRAL